MIGQMLCKQEFYMFVICTLQMQYIVVCSVIFRTMKQIPAVHEHEVKKMKLGRPQQKQQVDAFLEVARFLEENDN